MINQRRFENNVREKMKELAKELTAMGEYEFEVSKILGTDVLALEFGKTGTLAFTINCETLGVDTSWERYKWLDLEDRKLIHKFICDVFEYVEERDNAEYFLQLRLNGFASQKLNVNLSETNLLYLLDTTRMEGVKNKFTLAEITDLMEKFNLDINLFILINADNMEVQINGFEI